MTVLHEKQKDADAEEDAAASAVPVPTAPEPDDDDDDGMTTPTTTVVLRRRVPGPRADTQRAVPDRDQWGAMAAPARTSQSASSCASRRHSVVIAVDRAGRHTTC